MLLARSASFRSVLEELVAEPLATPEYAVVGGPEDGAIVSRGAGTRVLRFGEQDATPAWALVQTNYDPWAPDPASDPRRTVAAGTLSNFGRDEAASLLGLYAVLSQYPVHNPDTAYTAVMDPGSGAFHVYVRSPLVPAPENLTCWERCCRPRPSATGAECEA